MWCSGCNGHPKCWNLGCGFDDVPCDEERLDELKAHAEGGCLHCQTLYDYACVSTPQPALRMEKCTKEERHHLHKQCKLFCPELSHASHGSGENRVIIIQRDNAIGSIALCSLNNSRRVGEIDPDQSCVLAPPRTSKRRQHTNGEKMALIGLGDTGQPNMEGNAVVGNLLGKDGVHVNDSKNFILFLIVKTDEDSQDIPEGKVKFCRRWNLNGMVLGRVYADGPLVKGAVGAENSNYDRNNRK